MTTPLHTQKATTRREAMSLKLQGRISRNGPSGWDIVMRSPDGQYGRLGTRSDLFEPFRQAADLILSGESEGFICGSDKAFKVTKSDEGTRMLALPFPGVTYWLRENKDERIKAPVIFSAVLDFEFPEEQVDDREVF